MVSCSERHYLTFWNSEPPYNIIKNLKIGSNRAYDGLYKLKKRKNALLCYEIFGEIIYFWDYKHYRKLSYIPEISLNVENGIIETFNRKLIISNQVGLVSVVNIDELSIEKTYSCEGDPFGAFTCFYELKRNVIICGGSEGDLFLLDIEFDTLKCVEKVSDFTIQDLVHIGNNYIVTFNWKEKFIKILQIIV